MRDHIESVRSAAEGLLEAWDRYANDPRSAIEPDVAALRRAVEADDVCGYDDKDDPYALTLENFLHADNYGESMELERRMARPYNEQLSAEAKASQCYALACRYRHMLEHMIEMFGGRNRVLQHLRHLRGCMRHGTLPGPLPPAASSEDAMAAVAEAAWAAVTVGLGHG